MIVRWVCEKDKKKWLYPVDKCIYCKGPITKQKSKKAKVIGITKVNIPSPMHPIIPYNILLLEDEYGNRMPKKTMTDYKIGDEYKIEKAKTDGAVIITKIKYDIGEALKESINLLNSFQIEKTDKVLIKPTIIEPAYAYQAVNTNPRILDEIVIYLKDKGVEDIIIAEQAMLGNDTLASAEKAGILDVCKKHEVAFIDISQSEFVGKNIDGFEFKIAKEIMERKVINVPAMKTHSQIGISGAMENMIRAVNEETQKKMFSEDIEKTLPKLFKALPRFLTIGDAIIGLHGQGPSLLGEPAFLNMLFVSKDPVALDTVFSEMGMFTLPIYIKQASLEGCGNCNIENIEIVGDELEAIKFHLKAAEKQLSAHPKIKLIDGKANPYTFNSALNITSKLVGLLGKEINLVIGPIITKEMAQGKNRLVAYGNDAIQKVKALGIEPIGEIPEDIDDLEKIMLLKSVLESPEKEKITAVDKIKSKLVTFGAKIKDKF